MAIFATHKTLSEDRTTMKTNALSVANYFIDLAAKEGKPLHLLGLVKRVYIAHGFALALLHRGLLDPRFDKVEAWKYGPVIPSVYHSFKQYKANEITEKTVIMEWDATRKEPVFNTPVLTSEDEAAIVKMVWRRYSSFTDGELVDLTHKKGSPWAICFEEGRNVEIPDRMTELYYKRLVENVMRG